MNDHLWTGKPPRHGTRHPGLLSLSLLCGRLEWVPGKSWGSKQAYHMIHQPVSMVSQCLLIAWLHGLASGDQGRLTGSGSTLEAITRNALYKSTYFTLLSDILKVTICCSELCHTYLIIYWLKCTFWAVFINRKTSAILHSHSKVSK